MANFFFNHEGRIGMKKWDASGRPWQVLKRLRDKASGHPCGHRFDLGPKHACEISRPHPRGPAPMKASKK
jgi:hypothetical protein